MKIKHVVLTAVAAVAVAALTMPLVGVGASGRTSAAKVASVSSAALRANAAAMGPAAAPLVAAQPVGQQAVVQSGGAQTGRELDASFGQISPEVISQLGLGRSKNKKKMSPDKVIQAIKGRRMSTSPVSPGVPEVALGQPINASFGQAALSAAVMTNIGGRDTQFSEVALLADWDGREDCTADRGQKVDDFSEIEPEIDFVLTRTAISEHTIANGFTENIFYYGDSIGNIYIGADTTGDGQVETVESIHLPTALNAFGTILGDDQVTITGLAVNPVADLTSFANVNGAYAGFAGQTGEILYVTYLDTESGLRLASNNILVRSGLLAFPVADLVSGAPAPPGSILTAGFPVTMGGAFGVAFSVFSMVGGCAVDDDGNVYFQQADLIQFSGANIVKVTDVGADQDRSLAVSGILTITTLNPAGRVYGTTSGPPTQVNRFTNYSNTSTVFGNIVSIATGGCNVVYAAVSASNLGATVGDPLGPRVTQGPFPAPSSFPAGLPSMIISFADCSGGFDVCSGVAFIQQDPNVGGILPIADGLADAAEGGVNWRVFTAGNGPALPGTVLTAATLVNQDFQIDFSSHAGIMVTEEGTVFFISGGAPGGPGANPSPFLGEILCYEDACPADRRADFVDLRGNAFPNPPLSGGNVGDGDSDRFDHIFHQAPLDQITFTPTGLSGLARGFLRYTNRLAPIPIGPGVTLGQTDRVLGDDDFAGPVIFEALDPSHNVAGGDDQTTPFRGDDDNGAGNPVLVGPLSGGFEFTFGGPVGTANCVWNGLFWNSNGNVTFGDGDPDNFPTVPTFRSGLPKIAPAWADLNPGTREIEGNLGTFPVLALGFANINAFKIRWINVPEQNNLAKPGCPPTDFAACGSLNTFSVTLYDDGTGIDENASQPLNPANPIGNNAVPFDLQEGPTDLRFTVPVSAAGAAIPGATPVGCPARPDGSGHFIFDYCRMDLLGTACQPVLVGYSIGFLDPLNPSGLCGVNLSCLAVEADLGKFGVLTNCVGKTSTLGEPQTTDTASIMPCLIGEGTEPTIFELFNSGSEAVIDPNGQFTFARPAFDLRFEGNGNCTSDRQVDNNRGRVGFFGIGCAPPASPICRQVIARPTAFTPNAGTDLVDALCNIPLDIIGCGFFPNEVTIICNGAGGQTGQPIQRPGKTVSTAATLACDTNGDGIAESVVALAAVNPVNKNLIQATLAVQNVGSAATPFVSSTAFPLACCGGAGTITITTTFSAGDNNVFGPFTRTATCSLPLGVRAPVVISVTPSGPVQCNGIQNLLISGACFCTQGNTGVGNITRVFLQERGNPANEINAVTFNVLNCNLIDAAFNISSANAGKTFLIFVVGPGGTSRNLTALQPGQTCNVLGNESGVQVTFACSAAGAPGTGGTPDIATISSCDLKRNETSGAFFLDVFGANIKLGATVTLSGTPVTKVLFRDLQAGSTNIFTRVRLKKKICSRLPGPIVITNPGGPQNASQPFLCSEVCPAN